MSEAAQGNARSPCRWLKRLRAAGVAYLIVGLLTSVIGFNLLGAVFFSGPLFGRVVDSNGRGIRGAFVAYEWKGQSFHGSTGCQAAAIVRAGIGGFYVVPWQGWRLVVAMGWGISPTGPAVWAPGYLAKHDGKGNTVFVREQERTVDLGAEESGIVDKGECFGWPYHGGRIVLRAAQFKEFYDRVCVAKMTLDISHLNTLYGSMLDAVSVREGAKSAQARALGRKYRGQMKKIAWLNGTASASDVMVTPEQRDEFCSEVEADYLASGGHLN